MNEQSLNNKLFLQAHLNRYICFSDYQLWVWTTTTNSSPTMPFSCRESVSSLIRTCTRSLGPDWQVVLQIVYSFGSFHRSCLRVNASDMQKCWCTWAGIHMLILQSFTYSHAPKLTIPNSQIWVNIGYG